MKKQYRFKRYCRSLLIVKVGYPILYGIVAHSVQQLSFFPVQAWIGFFQFGNTVTDTASTGSGERYDSLAGEIVSLKERVDYSRCKVPPYRKAQVDYIVFGGIFEPSLDGRTRTAVVHLYAAA